MRSNDQEVLEQALRWQQAGQRCVLVTVLSTYGASPRPPGAMAVISETGLIVGSVSGGCVEDDLVHEVMQGHFWRDDASAVSLRIYGKDAAERERYRLPCGNALRLAIEGRWRPIDVTTILQAMAEGQSIRKQLHYATGEVQLHPLSGIDTGAPADFSDDAQGLSVLLGPRHRLLLIGATEVSRYLLPIARSLGYAVTICDPRVEYTGAWSDPDITIWHDMPDDAVLAFRCDARTAVITVTHDPKLDDLALMEALRSQAFYVGALGSSITTSKRKERLRLFDLSEPQIATLKGPVGLPIGSRTPAEIAVSIAAELIQVRSLLGSADAQLATTDWRRTRPDWMPTSSQACTLD